MELFPSAYTSTKVYKETTSRLLIVLDNNVLIVACRNLGIYRNTQRIRFVP